MDDPIPFIKGVPREGRLNTLKHAQLSEWSRLIDNWMEEDMMGYEHADNTAWWDRSIADDIMDPVEDDYMDPWTSAPDMDDPLSLDALDGEDPFSDPVIPDDTHKTTLAYKEGIVEQLLDNVDAFLEFGTVRELYKLIAENV